MGEFQLNNFLYRIELIDLFFFLSSCLPYYFYYTYSIQPKSKKFLFLFCLCVFRNWEMNVIRKWLKILLVLQIKKIPFCDLLSYLRKIKFLISRKNVETVGALKTFWGQQMRRFQFGELSLQIKTFGKVI